MSSPPPAYTTSSLSRGSHVAESRGRRSLPATAMTSSLTSWETFNDTDSRQPTASPSTALSCDLSTRQPTASPSTALSCDLSTRHPTASPSTALSCDSSRLSPLATAAGASGSDVAKEKTAAVESPVTADDVRFSAIKTHFYLHASHADDAAIVSSPVCLSLHAHI